MNIESFELKKKFAQGIQIFTNLPRKESIKTFDFWNGNRTKASYFIYYITIDACQYKFNSSILSDFVALDTEHF